MQSAWAFSFYMQSCIPADSWDPKLSHHFLEVPMKERPSARSSRNRSLHQRHRCQIRASYGKGVFPQDRQVVAYLPGDRHSRFQGKRFHQLGISIQVTLRYLAEYQDGQDWYLFEGTRRQETRQGWHEYDVGERLFHYNGLLNPYEDARAMRLDSRQQQELVELLLVMHSTCVASLKYAWQPIPKAILPAVWNGYAAHERPDYQDSSELRRTAAQRLSLPLHRLGQHGDDVLHEYLRVLWQDLWIDPDHPENETGVWLIESRYCESLPAPLLRFEDFSQLYGMRLTNPWWLYPDYDCENSEHVHHLRQLIPSIWRSAVTEDDWQQATRHQRQPLFASSASRIQVVEAIPATNLMAA
jgi:hypothetical protein